MVIQSRLILFLLVFLSSFFVGTVPASAAEGPFRIFESSDGLGGDCSKIGEWESSSKTCSMNRDISGGVIISASNATLDGKGHKITGENKKGNGIILDGSGASIKNVSVSNFLYGIYLQKSGSVRSCETKDNYYGIYAYGSDGNRISVRLLENSVSSNINYGITLYYTKNNEISKNSVGPKNYVGITQALSDHSLFEDNDFFENSIGMSIRGDYNILNKNKIRQSGVIGFFIESDDMLTNEIELDNLIDGHPIYYEKNVSGKTYDQSFDMGGFYCLNCQNITLKNITFPQNQAPVVFWKTNESLISGLNSQDKSVAIEFFYSSKNTVKENDVWSVKLNKGSNQNKIYRNNIFTNDTYMVSTAALGNIFYENPPVGGNYWEMNKGFCKDANSDGICDSAYPFLYSIDRYPLAKEIDFGESSGNSSVFFLPGIKASKLYKKGMIFEDQLWPPNYFGDDVSELMLTHEGTSIEDVYTRDVIRELPVTGKNIYESFANDLQKLKENGDINDYKLFAYDWRQSVSDIAQNGTPYEDGAKSAVSEIKNLAENSKSKKVTIVAHSNGGLLAKAIMRELEKTGETNKVDKIILVSTPQMGTPKAVMSLLYGYDESLAFGTLMSRTDARKLGENMPGAYGLLPSREYLSRTEEPLFDFSAISVFPERTRYSSFRDAYGENIGKDEFDKFQNFLTGAGDGREKPEVDEIEKENVLRDNLLERADAIHEDIDSWFPPEGTKVIQIAGWGLDTISGIRYAEKEKMDCHTATVSSVPLCAKTGEYEAIYEPIWTVDGDEVVTAPSSLMLESDDRVEKYWVDLYSYNDNNPDTSHGNIFEADPILQFISSTIKNTDQPDSLPKYVKTSRPDDYDEAKPRIRMSLYSPLDVHLYSADREKHTGPKVDENGNLFIEENIPNSYYQKFGERKYVGFPEGEKIQVELEGYEEGTFTLKLEEIALAESGEETIFHTTFSDLPVSKDTQVFLEIPESGLEGVSSLKSDFDGDGKIDFEVTAIPNGEAKMPDIFPPQISIFSPENETYPGNTDLEISFSVSDETSKEGNVSIVTQLNGEDFSLERIDLSKLVPGSHNFKISAVDEAKNRSEKEVEFLVEMNPSILLDNVRKYYQEGFIATNGEKNWLLAEIENIQREMDFWESVKSNPFLKEHTKSTLLEVFERKIENQIEFMIWKIEQKERNYDSKIKEIIIKDLEWIKNNL